MDYQIEISDKARSFHNHAARVAEEVVSVLRTAGVPATVEPVASAGPRTHRVSFEGVGLPHEAALVVFIVRMVNAGNEARAKPR